MMKAKLELLSEAWIARTEAELRRLLSEAPLASTAPLFKICEVYREVPHHLGGRPSGEICLEVVIGPGTAHVRRTAACAGDYRVTVTYPVMRDLALTPYPADPADMAPIAAHIDALERDGLLRREGSKAGAGPEILELLRLLHNLVSRYTA